MKVIFKQKKQMEEHYMLKIWEIFSLKSNETLSPKEQQNKIIEILSDMKNDVKSFTKTDLKKQFVKTVEESLKSI